MIRSKMSELKVQDVACILILQNPSMSANDLADLVKHQIPNCNCSGNSIAWYKNKLRKGEIKGFPRLSSNSGKQRTFTWPQWDLPADDQLLQLAKIVIPYIRFLHPDIIRMVVKDNESHREDWSDRLRQRGIDPILYFWPYSPCAFPGVRRHAGSTEIAQHRGRIQTAAGLQNALRLDDNDYPKHIWSFVFRRKPFQKTGPSGYSLAHLVDHKNYGNRGQEELENLGDDGFALTYFGLYTSVTNTVYMPNGLIRPMDFSFLLRNLIQRRANAIYGDFCQLLPPDLSFRTNHVDAWSLGAFAWREPVGTPDHVQAFLSYRCKRMEELFDATKTRAVVSSTAFTDVAACPNGD